MKFDFETQNFINTLQEMLQDYGRMALTDGKKCYSLWLDYAPQLLEEGDLLKVFLELGLGKQVVELKTYSAEQRVAWKKQAIENMVHAGETQKDATSLVDAVLEALGWGEKKAPIITKEPVKEPDKPKTATNAKAMPQQEKKTESKKTDKKADNKQASGKKSAPVLNMAKQELLNRWRPIMEAYMPMVFSKRAHKVDFDNLSMPQYIINVLNKRLKDSVQQYKFLAYGKSESKGIWMVLTDTALIVHSILWENNFSVVPYHRIQQMTLVGGSVFLKNADGWKQEIALGMESYCLVAMLRLMQGKVGDEVITRDEWQGFFGYWGSKDNTRYYIDMNNTPYKKQGNVRAWMNSVYQGYQEDLILAIVDETVFGSCKDATVITEDAIYHKSGAKLWGRAIADIVDMKVKGAYLDIFLKDCSKVTLWHMGKMPYFAQLIEIIVFIKQHSY